LIEGVDHFAIAVRDLESSIRWYEQALGFRVTERRTTRGAHTSMESAVLTCGQAMLVLVQGLEPECQVNRFIERRGEGVCHVAFAVSDLDEAIRRIERASAVVALPTVEDSGIRQAFLQGDAESGVRIELIERRGGRFSERSVQGMFTLLESHDLY